MTWREGEEIGPADESCSATAQSFGKLQLRISPFSGGEIIKRHWHVLLYIPLAVLFWWGFLLAVLVLCSWPFAGIGPVQMGDQVGLVLSIAAGILTVGGMVLYFAYWHRKIRQGYVEVFQTGLRIEGLTGFSSHTFSAAFDELESIHLGPPSWVLNKSMGRFSRAMATMREIRDLSADIRRSWLVLTKKDGVTRKYPLFTWYYPDESIEQFLSEVADLAPEVNLAVFA